MTDTAQFLRDVLVWPGEQSPGWINLHTNGDNNGKPTVAGWAFKTVDDFLGMAGWIDSKSTFKNAWMCMSQQSETRGKNGSGKQKALRNSDNATWLKAVWVDIDIKAKPPTWGAEPWKHYETLPEALSVLIAFVGKTGLPKPSYVINSGGGLHVYWASEEKLSPEEWFAYADGLKFLLLQEGVKCDAGLTTDAARLLRVPNTLNHKYDPPRKVSPLTQGTPYSFPLHLALLKNYKTGSSRPKSQTLAMVGAPDPAFASLNPTESLVVGPPDPPHLVDPTPVFQQCAFLKHTKDTGGADFDQPKWNISVLCSAFMADGNAIAHEISKGHPEYDPDETQALYDRKVLERAEKNLGYPSCATIKGLGATQCEGCPLFAAGKSPLNIRPLPPTVKKPTGKLVLPDHYHYEPVTNRILYEGGKEGLTLLPVFLNSVFEAQVYRDPNVIRLLISQDLGRSKWVEFKLEDVIGQGIEKTITKQGLLPACDGPKLGKFFMAFMDKMWAVQSSQPHANFGWYRNNGVIEGFSCGGTLFKLDGTEESAGTSDQEMMSRYTPIGTVAQWHHVASYILRQERDDFDAILAYSFGSALLEFTGQRGGMFATMGEKAGGKSYALLVAAAVWGDPGRTTETQYSTVKGTLDKMGKTNSLPAAWDEVSDPPVQQKVYDMLQVLSGGGNGSRLNSSIQQQVRNLWCTIVNINGNQSFRAFVASKQKNLGGAGLRRILEYWAPKKVPNQKGQVPPHEADMAKATLYFNFGMVGQEYGKYLATNFDYIQQRLLENTEMFNALLQPDKEENMWLAIISAVFTGAELANNLPTPVGFRVDAMKDFLVKVFLENRAFVAANCTTPSDKSYAADFLVEYLKARTLNTVWTLGAPKGRGRMSHPVPHQRRYPQTAMVGGCHVHFDQVNRLLHISRANFEEWCDANKEKRSYSAFTKALKETYGVTLPAPKRTLAAGTPDAGGQERCFTIEVRGYPDLEEMLDSVKVRDPDGLGTVAVKEAAE